MNSNLPLTGTAELLELLSPFVPDDFINHGWPTGATGGRRRAYTTAQLYRVHLLGLLTPVHSLNLLVTLLPEQRAWRKFAGLRRHSQVPGVRVLHEFRERVGVLGLRQINEHLLAPLLEAYAWRELSVGLIDATDLPAACGGFKKKHRPVFGPARRPGRPHAQARPKPLLCRLQKTHAPVLAARLSRRGVVGAAGQLGHPGQSLGRGPIGAQSASLPTAMGVVSPAGGGGHGLLGCCGQTVVPGALAGGSADQAAQ
ncbi:MAG: transposase [Chloroflexota bacterium]